MIGGGAATPLTGETVSFGENVDGYIIAYYEWDICIPRDLPGSKCAQLALS